MKNHNNNMTHKYSFRKECHQSAFVLGVIRKPYSVTIVKKLPPGEQNTISFSLTRTFVEFITVYPIQLLIRPIARQFGYSTHPCRN